MGCKFVMHPFFSIFFNAEFLLKKDFYVVFFNVLIESVKYKKTQVNDFKLLNNSSCKTR
jgi:hypothetical protein